MEFEETARLLPTPAVFVDTDHDPSPRLTRAIFSISSDSTLSKQILLEQLPRSSWIRTLDLLPEHIGLLVEHSALFSTMLKTTMLNRPLQPEQMVLQTRTKKSTTMTCVPFARCCYTNL